MGTCVEVNVGLHQPHFHRSHFLSGLGCIHTNSLKDFKWCQPLPDTHPSTSCQGYRRPHWCRCRHSQGWCSCFLPYKLQQKKIRKLKKLQLTISTMHFWEQNWLGMIPAPLASVTTRQVTGKGLDLLATFTVHLKTIFFNGHFYCTPEDKIFHFSIASFTT